MCKSTIEKKRTSRLPEPIRTLADEFFSRGAHSHQRGSQTVTNLSVCDRASHATQVSPKLGRSVGEQYLCPRRKRSFHTPVVEVKDRTLPRVGITTTQRVHVPCTICAAEAVRSALQHHVTTERGCASKRC